MRRLTPRQYYELTDDGEGWAEYLEQLHEGDPPPSQVNP